MKPLTWVEIDLGTLKFNLLNIKHQLASGTQIAVVVKSNAYGYGFKEIIKFLISQNVNYIAVGNPREAIQARKFGYLDNLMVLSEFPFSDYPTYLLKDPKNILCLGSLPLAISLSHYSQSHNLLVSLHIKVDFGINRSVLNLDTALGLVQKIISLQGLNVTGLMVNFSDADNLIPNTTYHQLSLFNQLISQLKSHQIKIDFYHVAASSSAFELPRSQFNLIRIGSVFFGLQSSTQKKYPIPVKLALSWKTRLIRLRTLSRGSIIGYSQNTLSSNTIIGVIPVGYSLGLKKHPHQPFVLVDRVCCPILEVNMSESYVALNACPKAKVGSEVVLVGKNSEVNPQFIAQELKTVPEEIVTSISPKIRRSYFL